MTRALIRTIRYLRPARSAGLIVVISALLVGACSGGTGSSTSVQTSTVKRGTVEATVNATGSVKARSDVTLSRESGGSITEVLVKMGDRVTAGQPLLRVDTRELELQLAQAEANLASATAKYEQTAAGATAKELAQAQSAVESAQAKYRQTLSGTTTDQDLANAAAALRAAQARLAATQAGTTTEADLAQSEAALRSAEAKLADLQAGPKLTDVEAKTLALTQARESRSKQESQLSNAKEQARLSLEQAAGSLRTAQSKYGASKLIYDEAVRTGKDPNVTCTSGQPTCNNKLSDLKLRSYKADFEAAEQALRQAEQSLEQRRLAYEDARKQEIVGLETADSQIAMAENELNKVKAGATTLELTQAQAAVDQARAGLAKLQQPVKATDLTQAQAAVDQAHANLAKLQRAADADDIAQAQAAVTSAEATLTDLKGGPKASDLATTLASLKQAEVTRDLQRLKLSQATLVAPFAGVVGTVAAMPGQQTGDNAALISLVDDSVLSIDVNVAESDIAKIALGQPARATFAALPDRKVAGKVAAVAPKSVVQSNVVSYLVTVTLDNAVEAAVKTGMTANVAIIVAQRLEALSVPNRAVQTQNQQKVVLVQSQGQATSTPVGIGLVGDSLTEITSGVSEGDVVVISSATAAGGTATTKTGSLGIPGLSGSGGVPGGAPPPKP